MIKNKKWIMKEIKQHLWETEGESYTGYEAGIDFVKALIEEAEPQLNENQQIVLEWMKKEFPIMGVDTVLSELTFLSCTGGMLKNKMTATAWRILSDIERLDRKSVV